MKLSRGQTRRTAESPHAVSWAGSEATGGILTEQSFWREGGADQAGSPYMIPTAKTDSEFLRVEKKAMMDGRILTDRVPVAA